jgi:hypothetical protein
MSSPNRFDWEWLTTAPLAIVFARIDALGYLALLRWRRELFTRMKGLTVYSGQSLWVRCGLLINRIDEAIESTTETHE